jgi:deoxyribose-phosphate aldolase
MMPAASGPRPIDLFDLTLAAFTRCIDHTLLRPEATRAELESTIATAVECGVATVCVRPCDVAIAAREVRDSGIGVSTVIGFPHGTHRTISKVREAEVAIADGATELDMVANTGWLLSGLQADYEADIAAVVRAAGRVPVKVIIETAYLDEARVAQACVTVAGVGGAFVKNATGFSPRGATVTEIELMRRTVGLDVGVKAAGGVRSLDIALDLLRAGASRLGCTVTRDLVLAWRERYP